MTKPAKVQRPPVPVMSSPFGLGGNVPQPAIDDLSDVNATSPDEGDVLVWDDYSQTWVAMPPGGTVPDGTDPGDLLVWDGAAWDVLPIGVVDDDVLTVDSGEALGVRWAAGGGPGGSGDVGGGSYVWLQTQTASASAQLDFTNFISSTYEVYEFVLQNVLPATNGTNFVLRMGTGGTPTWDTTSGNYIWSDSFAYPNTGGAEGASAAQQSIQLSGSVGNSLQGVSGTLRLFAPSGGTANKPITYQISNHHSTVGYIHRTGMGLYTPTTAITGIRFVMASGNITSGTIRVYGIATS